MNEPEYQANVGTPGISVPVPTLQRPLTKDDLLVVYGPLGIGWALSVSIATALVVALWRRFTRLQERHETDVQRRDAEAAAERRRDAQEMAAYRDRNEARLLAIIEGLQDVAEAKAERSITSPE